MHLFQALLLGLVQGITEFFPVSSSAHLKFARYLMGMEEGSQWLYFDLACHAGTWLALVWFLRRDIWGVLTSWKKMGQFTLALLPLVPAYFFLKPVREALSSPQYTGYFLLATAGLLYFASRQKTAPIAAIKKRNVLSIGLMQSLALLPGLSRSGSTIAAGRFCGWSWSEAARFSFLLAIPTILGGEILETMKLLKNPSALAIPYSFCAIGALTSFAVGIGSVRFVFWFYERQKILPFICYCIAFGTVLLAVFHG